MRTPLLIVTCLLLALVAAPALAQEPSLAVRSFDGMALLTRSFMETPFDGGLPLRAVYHSGDDDRDGHFLLEPEQLVDLIRENIAYESWDQDGRWLELSSGKIIASNTPEVLSQVAKFIDYVGKAVGRRTVLEIYRLPPTALVNGATHELGASETKDILDQSGVSLVGRMDVPDGPVARLRTGSGTSFIGDYEVEVAESATISDPVRYVAPEGLDFRVRALAGPSGQSLLQIVLRSGSLSKMQTTTSAAPGLGQIQLPTSDSFVASATGLVSSGGSVLLGAGNGRQHEIYLVRASWKAEPQGIIPGLQIVPLGALAATSMALSAPRLGDEQLSAGPIYPWGDEVEPRCLIEVDRLIELTKSTVNPAWDEEAHRRIDPLHHRFMVIRAEPEQTRKARAIIERMHATMARNITVELRAGIVTSKAARQAAAEGASESLMASLSTQAMTTTIPNHDFRVILGTETAFVKDYDVEIAKNSVAFDPIISTLFSGLVWTGRADPMQDGRIGLAGTMINRTRKNSLERFSVPHPLEDKKSAAVLHIPRAGQSQRQLREVLDRDQWTLLHVAAIPGGDESLVVMVRVRS